MCPIFFSWALEAKNAHIEIPFAKNRRDKLVWPIETEKIDTAVFSLYATQRGGLTDKAVVCDVGGPWFESTCEHNIFSSFYFFSTSFFMSYLRKLLLATQN